MRYYVDVNAVQGGDGSSEKPFRKIQEAADKAVAGDEVIVAPGVYREAVSPVNGGREDARIVYRSEVERAAVITGAESVKDWIIYYYGTNVNYNLKPFFYSDNPHGK